MQDLAEPPTGRLTGLQRLLGVGLPPRNIDLRFPLPPRNRRGRRPPLTPERAHVALGQRSTTPEEYLKELLAIVLDVNRWPLSPKRKFPLLESLAGWFYVAAAPALLELLADDGGIPEPAGRRHVLELHDRCAAALMDGYRILFARDYGRSNFFYVRARNRTYRCACRMLELIKLRQRIAGMRYLRLDPDAWRTAHTVFAAMRACEPVDVVLDTLSLRNQSLDRRTQASLRQHYVSLASYGILDYTGWPERDQLAIDVYAAAAPDAIRVTELDPRLDPRPWYLYASCYDDEPPAHRPPDDARQGPTLLFDHRALAAHIRDDTRALAAAIAARDNFRTPPRLARIESARRTPVAYLLQRNLRINDDWTDDAPTPEQHRDLRIYAGFPEVRAHLLAVFRRDDGRVKRSRELSDLFAQRSAMIGEDDSAPQQSLWYVLRDSQNSMRIKTQETRFTNRMFVGNLLAYGFGEDEVRTPRIGKVNRIYRPMTGMVLLDIDYLANFGTPVRLFACRTGQTADASEDPTLAPVSEQDLAGEPMTALLIHHPQHRWGIITPPQDRLWQGATVCIQTGKRLTRARLGEALDVTNEFCRFQVASAKFPDTPPRYPQRDTTTVRQTATTPVG
ncbi:hypothetical protein [Thiohalocapsa sp.]|uniref:hypothetical protein n=1 Tax=Thiohalocapsa sp. TaxID=2497641 RepID=UPI0025E9694B|nr:hypothetical protein [Thiohalocapsa sp.]